jgi:HAMP domain-containing protein
MSLRSKFLLVLTVLVLTTVSVSTWIQVHSALEARKEEMEARATALGQFIGLKFTNHFLTEQVPEDPSDQTIKFWVREVEDAIFLQIFNTDGNRIVNVTRRTVNPPPLPEVNMDFIRTILNGEDSFVARRLQNPQIVDFLVPVALFDTQLGLVRIGLDGSRYQQQRNEILRTNTLYGSILLFVMVLIGYLSTPYLTGPLKKLYRVAERFGQGDFSVRSSVNTGDEIQELSEQFNRMANQLKQLVDNLSDAGRFHRLFPYIIVPRELYAKIVHQVRKSVGCDRVALILNQNVRDSDRSAARYLDRPKGSAAFDTPGAEHDLLDEVAELSRDNQVNPLVRRSEKAQKLAPLFAEENETISDVLVYRLETNRKLGYLVLGRKNHNFPESELRVVSSLLPQIRTVISNAQNFEDILVDERTGIYPRKVMHLALSEAGSFDDSNPLWLSRIALQKSDAANFAADRHLEVARSLNEQRREISPVNDPDHFIVISHDRSDRFLALFFGWSEEKIESVVQELVDPVSEVTLRPMAGIVPVNPESSVSSLLERAERALDHAHQTGGSSTWIEG